ncbi:MAG TPA: GNAT family N-acetyltransferase [Acidimicrobiales bacterium]|jgi:predicted acetyltransferase|nr:GNAT family N-acetyltransferase [Acidimicrobiales bacterium]
MPDIETLRAGDEGARDELTRLAFGRGEPIDPQRPRAANDQVMAVYAGDRLVGAATFFDEAQWFGGRAVPCGAVASVCVAPDQRGQRLAQRMVGEALQRMRARGDAISALYPTTASLYRLLGYEIAGWWSLTDAPLGALAARPALDPKIALSPGSFSDVDPLYDRVAPNHDGWLQRSPRFRATSRFDFDAGHEAKAVYRAERDGDLVGLIAYREVREGSGRTFDVATSQLVALDGGALRALLDLVVAHGTMADALRTNLPADLLVHAIPHAQLLRRRFQFPWMLRIVDAPRAIAARGFAPQLDLEIHLELEGDDTLTDNNGRYVLRVKDGAGTLVPGGRGTHVLDVRELAAAYTGLGGVDPELRLAFAGRPPTLVDFF